MLVKDVCYVCERPKTDARLDKCPVCHKQACFEHSYRRSGKAFCSKQCAEYFFMGDEDDQSAAID